MDQQSHPHHHHHHSSPSSKIPYRHGRVRFFALFLLAMVMFGNQYAFNNPQALEDDIIEDLDIDPTQYNMLYTIFALPNIFATFFIGVLIDFLGVRIGIIALSSGVALFQIVVAIGGYTNSYYTMLAGRMLFGIASESLVTAQASFVSIWFVGKQLAFALGLAITIPQLGNALNSLVTPMIYEQTQSLGTCFMTSVGICIVSVICALGACYIDLKADESDVENDLKVILDPEMSQTEASEQIKCSDLKYLKGSFWLLVVLCMFAVALYVPFLDNVNSLFHYRFCYSTTQAGTSIMITYLVSAIFSAPLGFLIDKIGCKRYFIISSMVIFTVAQSIILFWPQCQNDILSKGAGWGLFLLGFGYCCYANCIVPSIPLVVKKKIIGTAFGIMQMIESIALAFFPIISSEIVSAAGQGNQAIGFKHSSLFFVTMGLTGIFLSLGLLFISDKAKRKLDATSKQLQIRKLELHSLGLSHTQTSDQQINDDKGDIVTPFLGQSKQKEKDSKNQPFKSLQLEF